ncbi:hypothetical protein HYV12_02040 [Candidatus Dojkabacteria bacterium]|nr:hypothetical protein [Candidatus Dojkabacteria bacterium]
MNKILSSILTIAVVGALTVGATFAVFNERETIAGNTVATGEFNLTLDTSEGKPYNIPDAYPGFLDDWESIDISNVGPASFEAYMSFEKTDGSSPLYNELTMKLTTAGEDDTCNTADVGENLIYEGKLKNFVPTTLVSSLDFWSGATEEDNSGTPADNVAAGTTVRICQQLGVAADSGNEIMGESVVFSEIVDAVQDND